MRQFSLRAEVRTQQSGEDNEPSPNVKERLDDLLLLKSLVFRSALLVADPLDSRYSLLSSQHHRIRGRVGHEQEDRYAHCESQRSKQQVDDLPWCEPLTCDEGNTLDRSAVSQ